MAPTVAVIFLASVFIVSHVTSERSNYAFARVESCNGCSLNRLPDVKQFVLNDVPQYKNVEFKHIQGAIPELVLFNENDEEVERLVLSRLTRDECNDLLVSKGFTKVIKAKDEI